MSGPHIPSPSLVEVAHAWQQLAGCQQELDRAAEAARDAVALPPLEAERPDCFDVSVESFTDHVEVRVSVSGLEAGTVRAWATPNLVLLRGTDAEGHAAERLVRLPAPVQPDSTETDVEEGLFRITLDRRDAVPVSLWAAGTA